MRVHVEATWGRWSPDRVERESREDAVDPDMRIIQCDGEDCGVFHSNIDGGALWVRMLFVLIAYQRRGIGKELLRLSQLQAQGSGLPVRLRVLKANPAKRFYEEQGFMVYEESDEFFYMQRHC